MLRLLPVLIVIGLALLALIDCLARDEDEIRGLPKVLWVFVILLFPLLGSLAWFLLGRPRGATGFGYGGGSGQQPRPTPPKPLAPDDDPEFLRSLNTRPRDDEEDRK
ncbi:PLD nuclease N-terminal domain-containing protein [Virgisporangium aliadipatigenens]|nr:PLD nuclease N-terminal domain-containing protein [Virgisporangium aliadipatigenens]